MYKKLLPLFIFLSVMVLGAWLAMAVEISPILDDPAIELNKQENSKNLLIYCKTYPPANFDEFVMCQPYL